MDDSKGANTCQSLARLPTPISASPSAREADPTSHHTSYQLPFPFSIHTHTSLHTSLPTTSPGEKAQAHVHPLAPTLTKQSQHGIFPNLSHEFLW